MSASPNLHPEPDESLIPLSVLGLRDGEDLPGMPELCRLTVLFFGVSMFAVTWLRDATPVTLWSNGACQRAARLLARWSYPALHAEQIVTLTPVDMALQGGGGGGGGGGALIGAQVQAQGKAQGEAQSDTPGGGAQAGAQAETRAIQNDTTGPETPIGFFAAAPLTLADGMRVGALCIADAGGRAFTEEDAQHLRDFAAVASEALRAQKTLADTRRREQLLARAFRLAKVGGWEYNVITGGLILSEQALEIYGLDAGAQPTLDMMMRRFYPGDTLITTREDFIRLLREGKGYDSRRRIRHLDGSTRWIHVLAEPETQDGQVVRIHGLVEDITDEIESQRRFHELAYTDKLTSLPNRGAFLLELDQHFDRRESVALIAIDIDGFKDINDTIGHHAGDQLLIEVGKRITAYFPVGTFAARVGSNEFTIIAPGHGETEILVAQMEQLRLQLKEPVHYAEHTLAVSVSIGLCAAPAQAHDADQIIRSTDIALYQAKKAGGDRTVVFEPEMRDRLEERVQLLRDVRRGIERKEFILYYQPIYDMRTQTLSGFEALMRWSLPEKGILAPGYFSAAFDDQSLAPQLGNEALSGALAQMRAWMDKGFDFKRVSVNVAAAQFYQLDLAGHILAMLKEYGLRPDQLTLEITESVYLGPGADDVEEALRVLHRAGVGIALDDFGTGYASLTQLQRFPVDSLKIDKSFVQNPDAGSIVDAIIALGTSLNIQIVAEGVETRSHQDGLLRRGCQYGQGYFLGKPMPAEFYA